MGRLMAVTTAMATLHPQAELVTARVEGDGLATPVEMRLHLPATHFVIVTRPERSALSWPVAGGRLRPGVAPGGHGTLSLRLSPSGAQYEVPLVHGEIGEEFAALLAQKLRLPAAVLTGEFLLPSGVKGAGLVLVYLSQPAEDAEVSAAEEAVQRFGRLS